MLSWKDGVALKRTEEERDCCQILSIEDNIAQLEDCWRYRKKQAHQQAQNIDWQSQGSVGWVEDKLSS